MNAPILRGNRKKCSRGDAGSELVSVSRSDWNRGEPLCAPLVVTGAALRSFLCQYNPDFRVVSHDVDGERDGRGKVTNFSSEVWAPR